MSNQIDELCFVGVFTWVLLTHRAVNKHFVIVVKLRQEGRKRSITVFSYHFSSYLQVSSSFKNAHTLILRKFKCREKLGLLGKIMRFKKINYIKISRPSNLGYFVTEWNIFANKRETEQICRMPYALAFITNVLIDKSTFAQESGDIQLNIKNSYNKILQCGHELNKYKPHFELSKH